MEGSTAPSKRYVELAAYLIDREIANFRRGEQTAAVSFTNVVKLARNATDALMAAQARGPSDGCRYPDLPHRSSRTGRQPGAGESRGEIANQQIKNAN
jgi:hypothetical protein